MVIRLDLILHESVNNVNKNNSKCKSEIIENDLLHINSNGTVETHQVFLSTNIKLKN